MKTVLLIFISFASFGQVENEMLAQVNALRGKNHQLTYNQARQAQLDKYATSDQLLKRFQHSIGGDYGEIIIKSHEKDDLVDKWRASKKHRQVMVNTYFKSMACKVVVSGDFYYGVIRFYH